MSRDLTVAVSLAGLCHLKTIPGLAFYTRTDSFLMKAPPSPAELLAILLNVLLLAALLFGLLRYSRTGVHTLRVRLAEAAFLFFVLVAANSLRTELVSIWPTADAAFGLTGWIVVNALLGVTAVVALIAAHRRVLRVVNTFLLILSPLVPIAFARTAWNVVRDGAFAYADAPRPARTRAAKRSSGRVVWVIFDEWDYGLSFVDRPAGADLSEIDRLRRESFEATRALPAAGQTILSIPALLTGRRVTKAQGTGPNELLLTFAGSAQPTPLRASSTVFSRAAAEGFRTGVVGWYLPYCRMLIQDLNACAWCDHDNMPDPSTAFGALFANQIRAMFETNRFSLWSATLAMEEHEASYRGILRTALAYVADHNFDLLFLHFNIPHAPTIKGENPVSRHKPAQWYSDNLSLLDRTWAELRHSMEASGTWNTSTVLLTSDHPLRGRRLGGKPDSRIPFLAHFAGQVDPTVFDLPLNTINTQNIVMGILRGHLATADSLYEWAQARASEEAHPNSPAIPEARR